MTLARTATVPFPNVPLIFESVIVGLALDLTGLFRQRAAKRLGAAARGTPDTLVAARASL